MTDNIMTPEEFGAALDRLLEASRTLVLLPLDGMAQYIDRVEELGEDPDVAAVWTADRREATAHAARLIAAAAHVKATAVLGGAA